MSRSRPILLIMLRQPGSKPQRDEPVSLSNCLTAYRRDGGAVEPTSITGNTVDFEAIQKLGLNLLLENWRNP
jgi:hypothetical protein